MMADGERCEHATVLPIMRATSSVMAIQFSFFGMKCEKCGRSWDIGELCALLFNSDGRLDARPVRVEQEGETT